MAVTIANSTPYDGSFLSSHSISAFNTSGSNPYCLVLGFNKNPASEVSGQTHDGNAATLIDSNINANVVAIQAYGRIPADSSTDIVTSTPSFKEWAGVALNLNGVDQTTPYTGTPGKANGFGTAAQVAYTGTSGNMLIVIAAAQGDKTFTATNCTELRDVQPASSIGGYFIGYVTATGSSQTVGAALSANDNWRVLVIEIKASAAGAVANSGFLSFM